jgi:hypothetical protein
MEAGETFLKKKFPPRPLQKTLYIGMKIPRQILRLPGVLY